MSGGFLAVYPMNWDEIMDKDDYDEDLADPGVLSNGMTRPGNGDGHDDDDGEGEEHTQGGEKESGKGKGKKDGKGKGKETQDGKGNGKGQGKGNCKTKSIVNQNPGGDDICCAVVLQ